MCYECAVEFASAPAYQRVLGATEAGALPKCPLCRQVKKGPAKKRARRFKHTPKAD